MRQTTPEPARPSRRLEDSAELVDRVQRLRIGIPLFLMLLLGALVLGNQGMITAGQQWFGALALAPVISYLVAAGYDRIAGAAAGGLIGSVFSTGGGDRHAREYSEQEALVAQGRIAEAIDSFRSHLVAFPGDIEARLRLAAIFAGPAADTDAAERCYLEARQMDSQGRRETLIGNALIDLYQSSNLKSKLMAELSRFARLHHGTVAGQRARDRVRQLAEEDSSVN